MELKDIINDLIENITRELNDPENQDKIKKDIVQPFTIYVINQMYPYLLSTCIIILLMLLLIIFVLIILIRKM
jgi:Ca2+-dependent lipid-binding protein